MLGEELDAASAGFRVGYEDPSYFSRDYKKQFGEPPQRDIARLATIWKPSTLLAYASLANCGCGDRYSKGPS